MNLQIIPFDFLQDYLSQVNENISKEFEKLHDSELSINTFSFYTSVSAVFSSKIEGENIELDSFIKHKRFNDSFDFCKNSPLQLWKWQNGKIIRKMVYSRESRSQSVVCSIRKALL